MTRRGQSRIGSLILLSVFASPAPLCCALCQWGGVASPSRFASISGLDSFSQHQIVSPTPSLRFRVSLISAVAGVVPARFLLPQPRRTGAVLPGELNKQIGVRVVACSGSCSCALLLSMRQCLVARSCVVPSCSCCPVCFALDPCSFHALAPVPSLPLFLLLRIS
jgi:hypothetical protein